MMQQSGGYAFLCAKEVDFNVPGMVYIDGQPTESPILVKDRMFGQMIGVNIRKYIFDYNRRLYLSQEQAAKHRIICRKRVHII